MGTWAWLLVAGAKLMCLAGSGLCLHPMPILPFYHCCHQHKHTNPSEVLRVVLWMASMLCWNKAWFHRYQLESHRVTDFSLFNTKVDILWHFLSFLIDTFTSILWLNYDIFDLRLMGTKSVVKGNKCQTQLYKYIILSVLFSWKKFLARTAVCKAIPLLLPALWK